MFLKKLRKRIVYFLGWQALVVFSRGIQIMPAWLLYRFASAVGIIGYYLFGRFRRVALDGLSQAFGSDLSPRDIRKLARACFVSMAKSAGEMVYLLGKPDKVVRNSFRLKNERYLKEACAKGKGVILVSAHMGNFPFMLARLSLQGYKTSAIMRPLKDARIERFFTKERDRYGIRTINTIPRRQCVISAVRSLRNKEVMFLPLDQNFGTGGVFVDFFGRKAATATGPVVFAQRTGAAIVPCFVIRQSDNTSTIFFEPEVPLEICASEEQTIVSMVQKLTSLIEIYVRKYPAEWSWIHRRWKAQMPSRAGIR